MYSTRSFVPDFLLHHCEPIFTCTGGSDTGDFEVTWSYDQQTPLPYWALLTPFTFYLCLTRTALAIYILFPLEYYISCSKCIL